MLVEYFYHTSSWSDVYVNLQFSDSDVFDKV